MIIDSNKLQLCMRTMSPSTFFFVVQHHLAAVQSLSVVRMGDAEGLFMRHYTQLQEDVPMEHFPGLGAGETSEQWLKRMGFFGITPRELRSRLFEATTADFFAPSISGIHMPNYDLYGWFNHDHLVDNFFVNVWTTEQIAKLYDQADGITIVHANPALADALQRKMTRFKAQYVKLSSWQETEDVIEKVRQQSNQLVIFSGGCASKMMAPRLAKNGTVVLDIGNSMPRWVV